MSRLGGAVLRARDTAAQLAEAFAAAAERHADEPDIFHLCTLFAEQAETHAAQLQPRAAGPADGSDEAPGVALVLDMSDLFVLVQRSLVEATVVRQAALAARDRDLADALSRRLEETSAQAQWLLTRIKTTAPQALAVE